MELIDKSALVAEIERRKYQFVSQAEAFRGIGKEDKESCFAALASNMNSLLSFIDSLEVKEVDLDKEFDRYCDNLYLIDLENEPYAELFECAKHFFELGLKAQKGE